MSKRKDIIDNAFKYNRIVILIVIVLVVTGAFGLYVLPKQDFPTFTIRQGLVVGVYPGLSSSEIDEQLTKPLMDFIFEYEDVNKEKTFSQSKSGLSIINIELNENVNNKDAFWSKFKHNLQDFKNKLPASVISLDAFDDFGKTSALLMSLESSSETYRSLQEYSDNFKDELRKIDGIAGLKTFGLQKEQITVNVNPQKIKNLAINNAVILAKLKSRGYVHHSGYLENSNIVAPIHIKNELDWENDIAEMIIYSDLEGNAVKLKDVADVKREYPDHEPVIKNNGIKSILLSIEMQKGMNVIEVGREIDEALHDFQKGLPDNIKINSITDLPKTVSESVNSFLLEMLIAVISVILVIVAFMPIRVALVAAITIPITIFSALALFYAFGIELNTIILSALIVTLGMIVDDSVVVIDGYVEKLDEGEAPHKAAIGSPKKYLKSVISATLVISVTFFPFLLTTKGMFSDFLKTYPWAMTIILGLSLVIALLFTPFMQFLFIKKGINRSEKKRKTFLDIIQIGYDYLLNKAFRYKKTTLTLGFTVIATGGIMFFNLPLRLMPLVERNQFAVEIFLPNGKPITQTETIADSLENILREDGRVISVTSLVGLSSPRFHDTYAPRFPSDNFAQFIVNTTDAKATKAILDEYSAKYANFFTDAYVKFKQMDFSEAREPIEIRISGKQISDIKQYSDSVFAVMSNIPELIMIRSNFEAPLLGMDIKLNQKELSRLGVNKSTLALNTALSMGEGIPVTTIWDKDYPIDIVLKTEKGTEKSLKSIENISLPTMSGASVPLRQVATVVPEWSEGQIVRRNGVRSLSFFAEVERGYNEIAVTNKIKDAISNKEFPEAITISYGGMLEADNERLPQIIYGLAIAIILMLFILIFHFKKDFTCHAHIR